MKAEKRLVGIDENLGWAQNTFLGLQSVIACNLFLGPVVIISAMRMGVGEAAQLIALTFLGSGIATILQSGVFLRYPMIQGMSFATIGAVLAISAKAGWTSVIGSVMVASGIIVVLGFTGLFSKLVKRFVPPLVAGVVIVCVGLSLMPISWNSLINEPGGKQGNFVSAGVAFLSLVIILIVGGRLTNKFGAILRIGGAVWAIAIATIVASFYGKVDLAPVAQAPWVALPKFLPYGLPTFDPSLIAIMTLIMVIVLVESMGTWFTVSNIAGTEIPDKKIDQAVIGEGAGVLIGSFLNGVPVTSYGSNSGVLMMTRVLSKWPAVFGGVICILMAFFPKLMNLIAIIPASVTWGIYGVICIQVMMSGLMTVANYELTDRTAMIVGIPILAVIGTSLLPPTLVNAMPQVLSYIFGSAIAVGAVLAVLINAIIPEGPSVPMVADDDAPPPDEKVVATAVG